MYAKDNNLDIETEVSFAEECEPDGSFDACVCIRVLQFLSPEKAYRVIRTMQHHTKPGGYNSLSFMLDETIHSDEYFFPSLDEMKEIYLQAGWEVHTVSKKLSQPVINSPSNRIMHQQPILFYKPTTITSTIQKRIKNLMNDQG